MTDDDFDDLDIQPDDDDEGYVRIKRDDLKAVRKAARSRGAAEKRLAEYERRDKIRTAGLDGLSERQINALAREAGDDDSPEALRQIAVEFGWATPPAPDPEDAQIADEVEQHTDAAQVANGAAPPAQRTQLTPEDVNSWPVDKQMRLDQQHPDLYELLLRGETINLPVGFN